MARINRSAKAHALLLGAEVAFQQLCGIANDTCDDSANFHGRKGHEYQGGIEKLNAGIQLLNTTLILVPFPPVKVGTVIASVIGDTAELLESYFRTKEQRMGFRAAIDPSHALGPDASYASTVIQGAFVALGLLPIPGALKEWAEEGANAANAAKLRKAALMRAR